MTLSRRLIPLVSVAFLVAACGGATTSIAPSPSTVASGAPTPSIVPSPSAAPAALLLKVTTEGGFINPSASLAALPTVAVYSDGRILTPGIVDAIYPGPLVLPVAVRDVGTAGAAAILAAIKAAGLDQPATAGPGVPGDSGTNVFTVVVDGVTTTTRIAGNGPPGQPGRPIASGDAGREAALALLQRLIDPTDTWGQPSAADSVYAPEGYRVYIAPGAPSGDSTVTRPPVAWPLATPLADFGTPAVPDRGIAGLRQGVVLGADAATLAPVFAGATVITPFTSGGSPFTLTVRVLYPDELGG